MTVLPTRRSIVRKAAAPECDVQPRSIVQGYVLHPAPIECRVRRVGLSALSLRLASSCREKTRRERESFGKFRALLLFPRMRLSPRTCGFHSLARSRPFHDFSGLHRSRRASVRSEYKVRSLAQCRRVSLLSPFGLSSRVPPNDKRAKKIHASLNSKSLARFKAASTSQTGLVIDFNRPIAASTFGL